MLHAPSSQLSRVCGHGHIKKFWLMQTQKEGQTFDTSKNSVHTVSSNSPPARHAMSASKGLGWSSGYEDAGNAKKKLAKHALSFNGDLRLAGGSTSTHETDAERGDLRICAQNGDTASSSSRSRSYSSNSVASELESKPPVLSTDPAMDQAESLHSDESLKSDIHVPGDSTPSTAGVVHFRRKQHGERTRVSSLSSAPASDVKSCSSPSSSRVEPECENEAEAEKSDCEKRPYRKFMSSTNEDEDEAEIFDYEKRPNRRLISSTNEEDDDEAEKSDCEKRPNRRQESRNGRDVNDGAIHEEGPPKADFDSHNNPPVKACTLCGTTKTPMWRSGPQGPKSLCNACGIRFKKYRSFPGQSDSVDPTLYNSSKSMARPHKRKQNASLYSSDVSKSQQEAGVKLSVSDAAARQQKKSKWQQLAVRKDVGRIKEEITGDLEIPWKRLGGSDAANVKQEIDLDISWKSAGGSVIKNCKGGDLPIPWKYTDSPTPLKKIYGYSPLQSKLKKNEPIDEHRSANRFAKDEEEAAVLLMHLSCGLVY